MGLVTPAPAGSAEPGRLEWLARAEQRLAVGDVAGAEQGFDAAAAMAHRPDAEIGLVRTYLQAGQYARAMAFAAHAAGAHDDEPDAAALYIWLLDAGGQQAVAARLLAEARARHPEAESLREVGRRLRAPASGGDDGPKSAGPSASSFRLGPYSNFASASPGTAETAGAAPPARLVVGRPLGSATLIGEGRLAIAPAAFPPGDRQRVWLRNGLGDTTAAAVLRPAAEAGFVLLRLETPLRWPAELRAAPREPFAGSPVSVVSYADAGAGDGAAGPAWPTQRLGFLASARRSVDRRPLGIDLGAGSSGGPVFDRAGRLIGVALASTVGQPATWVPLSRLADGTELPGAAFEPAPAPGIGAEAVYERGLLIGLQVLAHD